MFLRARAPAAFALLSMGLWACGNTGLTSSHEDQLSFTKKPQITIVSPAPGAHLPATQDGMVEIVGTTRGSALAINGQSVAVDAKGGFRARVPATPGVNFVNARLNSLWGGEAQRAFVYGDFAKPGEKLKSGVELRATAKAFDDHLSDLNDFSSIAKAMLNQLDLMKLLGQLPPLNYDFGLGSVDIAITGVSMAKDQTVLDLSPKAVGAHLSGSFTSLVLDLHLVLHLLGDHPFNAVVSVDTVGFVGDLLAHFAPDAQIPDPSNPGKLTTGPGIIASMDRPDIALGRLTIDTDIDFPGVDTFVTWLANHFETVIADTVANEIQGNAANHFAAQLNQFGLPPTFNLARYGVDSNIASSEDFDARTSFDDQGVTIGAATAFSWPSLPAGAPGHGAPGSLVLHNGPAGAFPPATLGVSVSMDAINQGAFAVWGQGALERTVYPAKNYLLFRMDAIEATPMLPPVLQATSDGRMRLQLGDVVVTSGVHNLFFDGALQVTISAIADVTLSVDAASGALVFTLSGTPTIYIDVNDILGIVPDALLAPISSALQAIAPTIVANVVKPIAVPLPALPLSGLIQGQQGALGLTSPMAVSIDGSAGRVLVTGDLAVH